ncbi:hypothetical protein LTR16_006117, partial [Cryomyces antarcticus]
MSFFCGYVISFAISYAAWHLFEPPLTVQDTFEPMPFQYTHVAEVLAPNMTDVTNITANMTTDLTAWEQIVAMFLEMSTVSRFTTFFALAIVLGLFIFLIAHGTGSNPWLGLPNHYYDGTNPGDTEKDDTHSDDAEEVVIQKYLHLVSAVGKRFATLSNKVQDFVDESIRVNVGLLDS